ncbi:2-polyprenyl-3-methyl-5-hydroxy-6-metoxy-1,4-benzoquinol methylase [Evansella vedderi]|uniref:2-polyprenyl-3-methyl-5-hydroxy-6-metoxy-1, 4-benzoquinol methylase n=1 Tax=Evansella vedderi TaxID=38282 RepID=A0ABT9ZV79_9BACI|nr:class I SAM-dependent methyltransferase [Evansella vedderi]MDQ0254784.1 2-polyprenyl-3-methyl-5-hydroxy-6-metoxy-1,4-benzoquinol methylase [Evansella vedderi]
MELSPVLYHKIIRPKWINRIYIHKRIEGYINLKDKNVLDFGAGTGANCVLCKPDQYLGIDPDEKRINYAKKLYPNYDFKIFQNDTLNVTNQSLDVILMISVLHHISPEKMKKYVKQFRQALKPSGMIIAIEPCFFHKSKISNWYMAKNDNGDYIQYEQGYFDLFKGEGFNCKTIERFKKCLLYTELFFTARI